MRLVFRIFYVAENFCSLYFTKGLRDSCFRASSSNCALLNVAAFLLVPTCCFQLVICGQISLFIHFGILVLFRWTRVRSRIFSWCSCIPQRMAWTMKTFHILLFLSVSISCLYKCKGTFLVPGFTASLDKHSAEKDSLVVWFFLLAKLLTCGFCKIT